MSDNGKFAQLLKEQKLSLQKVSEMTGVTVLALEYLAYKQTLPKTHVAQKVSKALQVPLLEIWPELREGK